MSLEYFLRTEMNAIKSGEYGKIGLLCNQSSFSFVESQYLFQILAKTKYLQFVFIPEHGLFGELQDQVALMETEQYQILIENRVKFISLYKTHEADLRPQGKDLANLDTLIIDIQDVGSRYYTFATTLEYMMISFDRENLRKLNGNREKKMLVIERTNLAGRYVEGTLLPEEYQSFVGRAAIPHRHGLTIGELANFFYQAGDFSFELKIIIDPKVNYFSNHQQGLFTDANFVSPSPNIPYPGTARLYSGQCLWEGTNISEGRGVNRPFEIFGAPFLQELTLTKNGKNKLPKHLHVVMRPLRFIPTFHKFRDELCFGWQIHMQSDQYASLAHSIKLMRMIKTYTSEFKYRQQAYEFESEKIAIEILVGDQEILSYLSGHTRYHMIKEKMMDHSQDWCKRSQAILLHSHPLQVLSDSESDYDPI